VTHSKIIFASILKSVMEML